MRLPLIKYFAAFNYHLDHHILLKSPTLREYSTDRLQQLRLQLPQLIYHDLIFAILKVSIVPASDWTRSRTCEIVPYWKNHCCAIIDLVRMRFT